jgi:hypothetical protein
MTQQRLWQTIFASDSFIIAVSVRDRTESPNLNLIERLWRFMKRKAAYGRYHPMFADFRAALEEVLAGISTTHVDKLATLMTLNFQVFEEVSLLAA